MNRRTLQRDLQGLVQRKLARATDAARAAAAAHPDPRTACFYARRALELAVGWAY